MCYILSLIYLFWTNNLSAVPPLPDSRSSFRLTLPGRSLLTRMHPDVSLGGPQALPWNCRPPPYPPHTLPMCLYHCYVKFSTSPAQSVRRVLYQYLMKKSGGKHKLAECTWYVCVEQKEAWSIWMLVGQPSVKPPPQTQHYL